MRAVSWLALLGPFFILSYSFANWVTSLRTKSAVLDRSMPVAAMMPVWLRPLASATAWRMTNWRGVKVVPAWRANRPSARWPARCNRCKTDSSGEEVAVRACGMTDVGGRDHPR